MEMKYPSPLLNSLTDGVHLDMRAKMAEQFLRTPGLVSRFRQNGATADETVRFVFDLSQSFYDEAERRGLLQELPGHADLPTSEEMHVRRQAAAQVIGQLHANSVVQKESSRIVPGGSIFPG